MKRLLSLLALAFAIGANAATLVPIQLLNSTGSSSGQAVVSTGASSPPVWGGIGLNGIAAIAANTVLANATGASANPTAFAMPSCSTAVSALNWTSGAGFTCNTGLITASTVSITYAPLASPALTGTPTAPTASAGTSTTQLATTAFAQNAVTGGGNPGSFTTLISSGTFTPSQTNGIVGTTTNNNANAGSVGEYLSTISGPTSVSSSVTANATSESLTAGDWDVSCVVNTVPAGSTTTSIISVGINTTSATFGAFGAASQAPFAVAAGLAATIASPVARVSLSSTTTAYCVTAVTFATSTMQVNGFIRARRVR